MQQELSVAMALTGCTSIAQAHEARLDPSPDTN
jgi:isopentenyl diphosphate isomerase/L-lactate dehydrogenase-like FMN-dependent dehydrogenase